MAKKCSSTASFSVRQGPENELWDYWPDGNENKLYTNRIGLYVGAVAEAANMLDVAGVLSASGNIYGSQVITISSVKWDAAALEYHERSGTANYIPIWSNNRSLTSNSIISQSTDTDGGNTITIAGSAVVEGDLTIQGDFTYINTDVKVSEALSANNTGTGPALTVNQTGSETIAEFKDDGTSVFIIRDGGNIDVKAGATIDGYDVSEVGSQSDSVHTQVHLQSAEWNSTWNTLTANSGQWIVRTTGTENVITKWSLDGQGEPTQLSNSDMTEIVRAGGNTV